VSHAIGFQPDEVAALSAAGTSLAGRIPIGGGTPSLYRRAVGRLWPEIVSAGDEAMFQLTIDGYLVKDGHLQLGEGAEATRLAASFRSDPAAFMGKIENGCCNIVAHDSARQATIIANDETGCLPLYLHRGKNLIAFASDLAGLCILVSDLALDPVGRAELYWFGYQIGDRTVFKDVRCLFPGSVVTIDWRSGCIDTAIRPQVEYQHPPSTEAEVAADLVEAMRLACRRLHTRERRYAMKLSGGMDSRLIAGSWPEPGLAAFSFGTPGALECAISARLAEALKMPLSRVTVEGDFFSRLQAPRFAKHGIAEFFHQSLVDVFAEAKIDFALDGLAGDVQFGGLALKRRGGWRAGLRNALGRAMPMPDRTGDAEAAERIFSQICVPDFGLDVIDTAVREEIEAQKPHVLDDLARDYARCAGSGFSARYVRFAMRNRMRRFVALQGALCRPTVETLYPFLDRDLQTMVSRVASVATAGKRFYRLLYRNNLHQIAGVPFVDSLLPPGAPHPVHVLGRLVRYGMETSGYRLSLALGRDVPLWRVSAVQWARWIAFNRPFAEGVRAFMSRSKAFNATAFSGSLRQVRNPTPLTGTRIMLTASTLGLDSIRDKFM